MDGTLAKREIVAHNGGVAIIGLTENNEVLMVRQFRAPYKETIYEIPAGKLEKGEDPYEAAVREFGEECGCKAKVFKYIGELYPTPGYCGEIIRLYYAADLEYGEQHLDEDENLDVYKIPLEEAFERCMSGEFKDAKTQIGIMKIREMIKMAAYLDNSATTKPCQQAVEAINRMLTQNFANPSSLHGPGIEAAKEIIAARQALANALSCEKEEIFFTSGATEANNLALFGAAEAGRRRGNRIVISAIEHESVLQAADELEKQGFEVVRLMPDEFGCISASEIANAVNDKPFLFRLCI